MPNSPLNSALSKKPFYTRLNQTTLCRGILRLSTRSNGSFNRELPYGGTTVLHYLGDFRGVQPRCQFLKIFAHQRFQIQRRICALNLTFATQSIVRIRSNPVTIRSADFDECTPEMYFVLLEKTAIPQRILGMKRMI